MERIPAPDRTREKLKALMEGRSEVADGCFEADVCRAHSRRRTLARDPDHRVRAASTQGNPRGDRQRFCRAQCASGHCAPTAFIQQPADLTYYHGGRSEKPTTLS